MPAVALQYNQAVGPGQTSARHWVRSTQSFANIHHDMIIFSKIFSNSVYLKTDLRFHFSIDFQTFFDESNFSSSQLR